MDEEFKIEKGIPLPKSKSLYYPWDKMEVGDSFFVKVSKEKIPQKRSVVMNTARSWVLKNNNTRKYSTRTVKDGFRVWRIL